MKQTILMMWIEGLVILFSCGMFFNLKLPITDEVREQARNWRECPTGERLFETLTGWGTTIPQCLTKKSRKMALKFTKPIQISI